MAAPAPAAAPHLTQFTADMLLDDQLLRALLDHAPSLTHLSVHALPEEGEDFRNRVWAVKELTLTLVGAPVLTGARLLRLPVPRQGRMNIISKSNVTLSVSEQVRTERKLH